VVYFTDKEMNKGKNWKAREVNLEKSQEVEMEIN
jgi:hypothetical protein